MAVTERKAHIGGSDGKLVVTTDTGNGTTRIEFTPNDEKKARLLNIPHPTPGLITVMLGTDMFDLIREGIIDYPTGNPSVDKRIKSCKLKVNFNG